MSSESFWYRVGFALERGRERPGDKAPGLAGLAERARGASPRRVAERASFLPWPGSEELVAAGVTAVLGRLLTSWSPRHPTGVTALLRAGLAGAGAALLLELVRPVLRGEPDLPTMDTETPNRVLAGVAQGLVYGSVVEPRVPGPAVLKGALYGAAEYAVVPMGGLSKLFGKHTPQGRLPVVGRALDGLGERDRALLEHLVFGVVTAVLYGADEERSGIRIEVDDA